MKWFTCCNAAGLDSYWDMLRVAQQSAALGATGLEPHFVFDGPADEPRLDWLRAQGVTVHRHRVTFGREIRTFYGEARAEVAMGCFLRAEIPLLCDDEFVLYTDCDVMFTGQKLDQLAVKRPPLFCASTEFGRDDWTFFNSGVLLINVAGLRRELPRLPSCFQRAEVYDQPALFALAAGRWSRLKVEYNWKPYWGVNEAARIVHFHGPKPDRDELIGPGPALATPELVARLRTKGFAEYRRRWHELLARIDGGD